MSKTKQTAFSRILVLMLTVIMTMSIFAPMTAYASEAEAPLGESCATPTEAEGIAPLGGWVDEDNQFYTKIRMTVKDNDGNPISGVVYGLYRADNDELVEYITSNSYGIAESSDVPTDTDYYLLEYSIPNGWQENSERKDIILTEVCAPSRIDVGVEYDPVYGTIVVIKSDEYGDRLSGVGFVVYKDGSYIGTIYTNYNGEAEIDVPYGNYELYESDPLPGYEGGGYYYASISYHGETDYVYVTNYLARGYAYLHKYGNDGKNISGAVFSVFSSDGTWIEDITTNSSGYAYTSDYLIGDYYLIEKSVPAPYIADTETKHWFSVEYSGHSSYFSIENPVDGESGKLIILKTDDSENPLSDVVFGVYRAWDDKKLFEITSGADGIATAPDMLIPNDYYLLELSGKDGYEKHEGKIPFTIDGTGETVTLTVENPKIRIFGKVQLFKNDDAGNGLDGVKFGLYCKNGNLLEELETVNGKALSGILNEGDYYLKELSGIAGHLSNTDEEYHFSISENNVVVPVTVVNPRITGFVKVIKTAEDGKTPLAGVVFGIYKAGTDTKVGELTTLENGTATSEALFYSDYELRELSTVDGYELVSTPIPFSISEQDKTIEIRVTNPLIFGSVKVIKTDGETAEGEEVKYLAGAVFGVYNSGKQKISEITVGENGEAVYSGLPKGDFFLKELSAPESYIVKDDFIPFSITKQKEVVEITVANIKGYGTVKVIKHGEDNALLNGVVFEVYRTSTKEKVGEITTNSSGEAEIKLPLGGYYLKETKTVSGYALPSGTFSFTLTADGETVIMHLQNQKTPVTPTDPDEDEGKIRLIKKDDESGKLLANAVFGVYRASDNVKVCELETSSRGEAVSPMLPVGRYYLRELKVPSDEYELSKEKYGVTVKADKTVEIVITNKKITTPDPDEDEGKIRLIKKDDETDKLLSGAVFGVYRVSDDVKVCELETSSRGEAVSPSLPVGRYYLRELKVPSDEYELSKEKYGVTVKADKTVEITVTNKKKPTTPTPVTPTPTTPTPTTPTPTTPKPTTPTPKPSEASGTLVLLKKAEQTGKLLSGAVFGVYRVSDNTKVGELTSSADGRATMSLPVGDYYLKELKSPYGFLLEKSKIFFTVVKDSTVTVEVTNQRDESITDPEPIEVPKTGENVPYTNYIVGASLLLLSAVLVGVLHYNKKRKRAV